MDVEAEFRTMREEFDRELDALEKRVERLEGGSLTPASRLSSTLPLPIPDVTTARLVRLALQTITLHDIYATGRESRTEAEVKAEVRSAFAPLVELLDDYIDHHDPEGR